MKLKIIRHLSAGRATQAFDLIVETRAKFPRFDASGELLAEVCRALFPGTGYKSESMHSARLRLADGLFQSQKYRLLISVANVYPEFFAHGADLVSLVGAAYVQIGEKEKALNTWLNWFVEHEIFNREIIQNLLIVMTEVSREQAILLLPDSIADKVLSQDLNLVVLWTMVNFKCRPHETSINDTWFEIMVHLIKKSSREELWAVFGNVLQIFCWSGRAEELNFLSTEIGDLAESATDVNPSLWYEEIGEVALAHKYCESVVSTTDFANAKTNLGFLKLKLGNYVDGFKLIQQGRRACFNTLRLHDINRLDIWCDQGLGDVIFFSRYIPVFLANYPWIDVRICGDERLRFLFGSFDFVPQDMRFDAFLRLSDLPAYCDELSIRVTHPCFLRDLSAYTHPSGVRQGLGISWRSSATEIGFRKSTDIQTLLENFSADRVVSLQYGLSDKERQLAIQSGVLEPEIDINDDLEGLFRLVGSLSEVVTVSNLNAHIGGLLSIPTKVLVGAGRSKFWYWNHVDENGFSIFYPSVEVVSAPTMLF